MAYKKDDNTVKQHTQVYTSEDKAAFADRDRRITKLACLKCAVDVCLTENPTDKTAYATEIADKLVDWVYKDKVAGKVDVEDVLLLKSDVIVQPTDAEKKIIYQVAHTLNDKLVEKGDKRVVDVMKLTRWIYTTYSKYPTQQKSIQKILNTSGIESCCIENSFTKGLTK